MITISKLHTDARILYARGSQRFVHASDLDTLVCTGPKGMDYVVGSQGHAGGEGLVVTGDWQ